MLENVSPKCYVTLYLIITFLQSGGCWTGLRFRDMSIESVLEALKSTSHAVAQVVMYLRSLFSYRAAEFSVSTMIYKLMSSANSLTELVRYVSNVNEK